MHKDSLLLIWLGFGGGFYIDKRKSANQLDFSSFFNYKGKMSQEVKALQTQQLFPVPLSLCSLSLGWPELVIQNGRLIQSRAWTSLNY